MERTDLTKNKFYVVLLLLNSDYYAELTVLVAPNTILSRNFRRSAFYSLYHLKQTCLRLHRDCILVNEKLFG